MRAESGERYVTDRIRNFRSLKCLRNRTGAWGHQIRLRKKVHYKVEHRKERIRNGRYTFSK